MGGTCENNLAEFPYDVQKCGLTFGSWAYDKSMLMLECEQESRTETEVPEIQECTMFSDTTPTMDMRGMIKHGEWNLEPDGAKITSNVYAFGRTFQEIEFKFKAERHSYFYVWYMGVPAILMGFALLFTCVMPPTMDMRV